jgi:hypothetical protein
MEGMEYGPWNTKLLCWDNGGPSWGALGEKQVKFGIFLQCQQAAGADIGPEIKEKDTDRTAGKYAS